MTPGVAAQGAPLPAPPRVETSYPPQELDRIVSPIALYPDPEIPDAARWADQHHYLSPTQLSGAIESDEVPWQPSVQALLPFPQVLGMMAGDMPWTEELGGAFLQSAPDVMDAVQRTRQKAYDYGYLRSNAQIAVQRGPFIEIAPVDPAFVVVPVYDPAIVLVPPRRGVVVTGAIRFGYGVRIGAAFAPWGWRSTRFAWGTHAVIVNNAPWQRTWTNRAVYVHPFQAVPRHVEVRRPEQHAIHERSAQERGAERTGRQHAEEHKRQDDHR
jgi:hypothetical protein